jgi:hypothetical protein
MSHHDFVYTYIHIYIYITRISLKEREHEQRKADLHAHFFLEFEQTKKREQQQQQGQQGQEEEDMGPFAHVLHAVVKYLGSNKGDGTKVSEQATNQINYVSNNNNNSKRNLHNIEYIGFLTCYIYIYDTGQRVLEGETRETRDMTRNPPTR